MRLLSTARGDYEALYAATRALFARFRDASGIPLGERSRDDFINVVTANVRASDLPDPEDDHAVASKLLLSMILTLDADVAAAYAAWMEERYP